jgi:hypothetical protein
VSLSPYNDWEKPGLSPEERVGAIMAKGIDIFDGTHAVAEAIEAAVRDATREREIRSCECGADEACKYLRERDDARQLLARYRENLEVFVNAADVVIAGATNKGGQQAPSHHRPMAAWVRVPSGLSELRFWRNIFASLLEMGG